MQTFGSQDIYSVQKCGLLGEGSLASLSELYLPLIGARALGLYFALYAESGKENDVHFGDELRKKSGMTFSDIEASRRPLEAIGLLQTLYEKGTNGRGIFYFRVYAPPSPKAFFDDFLLAGTLHSTLGEDEFKKIRGKYAVISAPANAKDISENFAGFFQPDFNDPIFLESRFEAIGQESKKIQTSFDPSAFYAALKNFGYDEHLLSDDEMKFCEKASALYSYSSDIVGEFAADCIDRNAEFTLRLNRNKFLNKCREGLKLPYLHSKGCKSAAYGDSYLAKKIKDMDKYEPIEWLRIKQNLHKPSDADMKIVEALTLDIGLSSGACNVVIDYVLRNNNNVLSRPLAEKIGAMLVRANIESAQDAMEYLNGQLNEARKRRESYNNGSSKFQLSNNEAEPKTDASKINDAVSDEELDRLIEKAYQK